VQGAGAGLTAAPARPLGPVAKLRLVAEIAGAWWRARRLLRRRTLPETVALLRARGHAGRAPDDPLRLASAVCRAMPLLPADSRCLMRSLVLVSLLARRSLPATLVIGVLPGERFAAHAWVELSGRPLLPAGDYERLVEL
jgi:Transglutaminase-like superfamily